MTDTDNQLNSFRQWLQEQKPVVNSLETDEFLLRFLRITNFNIEDAKEWLVRFWKYRTENPQWFKDRNLLESPIMSEIAELGYYFQLPKETKDGEHIAIMRMGQHDPTKHSFDDVTKYAFAVTDTLNRQPTVQTNGFIIILDLSDVKLHHISQFTPDRAHRYVDCWEKMYPVKLTQIHYYNYPRIFDPILHLFKMFLSRKLSDRIFLHPKTSEDVTKSTLHQYVEPTLLPKEYGGELGTVEEINKAFIQKVKEQNSYIIQLDQYGIDLKQAPKLLKAIQKEQDK